MSGYDLQARDDDPPPHNPPSPYVELGVTTCFSFLRGASEANELALRAYALGYDAVGIADRNTLAGAVRMLVGCEEAGMHFVIGSRLDLIDAPSLLAYPTDRTSYGRLCRLLSHGKTGEDGARVEKGACRLSLADVADHASGLVLAVAPSQDPIGLEADMPRLAEALPLTHVAVAHAYRGDDRARITRLDALARANGLGLLATNDVLYAHRAKRPLQDVMTCIREKTTMAKAGFLLEANAERHFKSPTEMVRLFADWPHAVHATREILKVTSGFSLRHLRYEYPEEPVPEGQTPDGWLRHLTLKGAEDRYPNGVPDKVRATIEKELTLISKKEIARYFLTVRDIVAFARHPDRNPPILCQGRGSAANSAVCYCLGITNVDPFKMEVLFERFLSEDRNEPPDIDIDFEHERREEVIQHVYERYGRKRAGLAATVIHYRPRMAIREVGKVMGLSESTTAAMAKTVWGSWGSEVADRNIREAGLDPNDPHLRRTVSLASELVGMPRHLSQHVGGFVLTQNPLIETVPIGWGAMPDRSFIEWDKDDIDHLRIYKVDVLALGMLTTIGKCLEMLRVHKGEHHDLASIAKDEERGVYEMLWKADSLGVFQIESRAQMAMLPRLKPKEFYDLVIEVAIVRPGPIQGDMVHPYLRRREGLEPIDYPSPATEHGDKDELKRILGRTNGVPIFQEQAMSIAMHAAKFSPAEANELRKAMATFRSRGTIEQLQDKMVGRMIDRGYDPVFAQRCFDQIKGFGEYGFPESHAASFAHLVYVSCWLKWAHPEVFACALLNSQPMGFYAPAQIVRDVREHGVEVLPPDVNLSDWDCTLEPMTPGRPLPGTGLNGVCPPAFALRLGLRLVDGFGEAASDALMKARERPFAGVADLHARTRLPRDTIEALASADAMRSMGLDRRQALWDVRALSDAAPTPLAPTGDEAQVQLPLMPASEHVVADYQTLRLSLKAHPVSFLREAYDKRGFVTAAEMRPGRPIMVAGLVLVRQRPGSAKGVCFLTLEDETGVANVVVWPKVMEEYRRIVMASRLMHVRGRVQRSQDGEVVHLVAEHLIDATGDLALLSEDTLPFEALRADHVVRPLPSTLREQPTRTHPRDVRVIPKMLPKAREFH